MNLPNKLLWFTNISVISVLELSLSNNIVLAQIRGQDSQQFFDRGNQIMEQQIQQIEQENTQKIQENNQEKLENIETQLEIKSPDNLKVEEVPNLDIKLEDNVPESPKDEILIN